MALQIQLEVPHLKAQRAVVPGKDSRDLDGSLMSRASTRKALVKHKIVVYMLILVRESNKICLALDLGFDWMVHKTFIT